MTIKNSCKNIICVLKSGGCYDFEYVQRLYNGIKRNTNYSLNFACLTDLDIKHKEIRTIPLQYNFPGWWSKLELFRDDIFDSGENVYYFDLDTIICDNIDNILSFQSQSLIGLEDFNKPERFASGMMIWKANAEGNILQQFLNKPESHMRNHRYGDQEFIAKFLRHKTFLKNYFPNEIVSYKKGVLKLNKIPSTASVICFHGKPRIPDIKEEYVLNHWK